MQYEQNKIFTKTMEEQFVMLKNISHQLENLNREIPSLQSKILSAEKNISSLSEAQSSLINKMVAKPETMESTFAATHSIQVTIDENVRLFAQLHAKWEREAEIYRNNSVCTITRMDTTKPQEVPIPPPTVPRPNESTNSDAQFNFDIDGCNISEVILFLQNPPRSPDASDMHVAFTKHITDALVKIKEEKIKHKTSIPRKVEDSWEPIINVQVNDFDLKASCDLGSSVSIMPRKMYEMLIFPPLEDYYLDVPLIDNSKKKLMGNINDVLIMVNNAYVPVDFYVLDVEYNASCPITLGRPFLRTVGAIIDMKEGTIKYQYSFKKGIEHFPMRREVD